MLKNILRWLQRTEWMFRIVWRRVNGRWFIFRDAPDWVVCEYLNCDFEGLGDLAFDEMLARVERIKRDVLAAAKGAQQ